MDIKKVSIMEFTGKGNNKYSPGDYLWNASTVYNAGPGSILVNNTVQLAPGQEYARGLNAGEVCDQIITVQSTTAIYYVIFHIYT